MPTDRPKKTAATRGNAKAPTPLWSTHESGGTVHALAFSPDGRYLASGHHDGTARLFDAVGGGDVLTERKRKPLWAVTGIAFGRWGELVLLTAAGGKAAEGQYRVFSWDALRNSTAPLGGSGVRFYLAGLAVSPAGAGVAFAGRTLDWYDAAAGEWQADAFTDGRPCCSVAFAYDGRHLAACTDAGAVAVYDTVGQTLARELRHEGVSPTRVTFLPSGTHLVAGDGGGGVRVWDFAAGGEVRQWAGGTDPVRCLAAVDGRVLSAHGPDVGPVELRSWALNRAKPRGEVRLGGEFRAVALSQDGRLIAAGDMEGTITVWETASLLPDV